jgi:protein phosphatase
MSLPLRASAATHPGLLHPRNEDSHRVFPTEEGGLLLVVCDGMGGMGRGDEASRLAIDSIGEAMARGDGLPPDRMRHALRLADQRVRDELCASGGQLPGSTAVMVYVLDGAAHVAWVGDSRAYLVRDGKLVDRTRDHKLVEELVDAGQITAEQAKTSALAHVVTRALGGRPPDDPIVNAATLGYPWKLVHGDRILVCSDGVCDLVTDEEVAAMLGAGTVEETVQALVDLALARGGHDNITCIVGAWEGPSWVEDEQATPVMRVSREHLPDARGWTDRSEITWDGTENVGRVTEEIDLSASQEGDVSPAPAPAPAPEPAPPPVPMAPARVDTSAGSWMLAGGVLLVLAIVATAVALSS